MRLLNYRPTVRTWQPPLGGALPQAPQLPQAAPVPASVYGPTLWDSAKSLFQRGKALVQRGLSWLTGNLHGAEAPVGGSMPLVRRGSRSQSVKTLQQKLAARGFNPGPADGIFGPKTEAAVRAFQRARGLTVDGIVGPQTWGALGASGASSVASAPASGKAKAFTKAALRFLGQDYVWGGGHTSRTGVMGVDCSGLVLQAARMAGFNLDGTAADQQRRGRSVSMNALKPGDLLFHGTPASHVGIYLGNGLAVHASSTHDRVMIVNVKEYGYFNNARRVL